MQVLEGRREMHERSISAANRHPLKLGVVGLGAVAVHQHLPACLQVEEVDLVAVCRRTEGDLHRVADRFRIPGRYTDWHALLGHPGLDAVLVCTGPDVGPDICLAALERGLHVLTEKPLARDSAVAGRLVEAAGRAERVAAVGYMKLYYPGYARARALLTEVALGVPSALHARFWYQQGRRPDSAFHNDTHFYALATALCGPVAEVGARRFAGPRGHATAITLAFERGAVGTLALSSLADWDYPSHERVEVITERGHVLAAENGRDLHHFDPRAPDAGTHYGQTASVHWREIDGFVAQIRGFAQSILGHERSLVPFQLGLEALLLSEAVEQAVQAGRPVRVEGAG